MSVLMACELFSQGCVKCLQKCGTQLVRPEALKGVQMHTCPVNWFCLVVRRLAFKLMDFGSNPLQLIHLFIAVVF